ncbi:MAG TPA: type II toxin-antitoxin system HicB family antitoxin [Pyrinomonadaceae bacterium]|jgi:predicted RNase H-like HicB family nuclease
MIIEPGERNFSAYLPDLPGCVATGKTIEELRQRMSEAIELHLDGMREDGLPISRTHEPRGLCRSRVTLAARAPYNKSSTRAPKDIGISQIH